MNTWVRRGACVVVLSAGAVAAGSTAAQAADNGQSYDRIGQVASNSASAQNIFYNNTQQTAGLVAVNVTAGNIMFASSEANQQQHVGPAFYRSKFGWLR
ncbi:hypothetical protein [Cryptosporangium minutisporangium]|uniref:Uncharacterized protein n=1 Tax=Cryptosporangium minutisporangium TaxID=113569 RepID=A0ABP6T8J4_9ACTN